MAPLGRLVGYFLKLGTVGFGGPVALVGYMQRDLVEQRAWFTREQYLRALAFSQLAPGPLAAQLAMCLGFTGAGIGGATATGLAFVLPSYVMTVALAMVYVRLGGLPWMRQAFYGIGAAVIGIIALAAFKLARLTVARDRLLLALCAVMLALTAWTETEIIWAFLLCGVIALLIEAPPAWLARLVRANESAAPVAALGPILWFFAKAGAFVFGSGLAIVPFLHGGVVVEHHWLSEQQFLDAVAVAMLTPGPVVITVAFIGYLVAGQAGAAVAAIGVFLPVYLFVVVPFRWFDRYAENPQVKAFVRGVTAAAAGGIGGACVVLARRAIIDLPTLLIAVASLALLLKRRVSEPVLILGAGALGLVMAR